MAKVKKATRQSSYQVIKNFKPWLENKNLALRARILFTSAHNKIAIARKVAEPRAARAAARYGAPAGIALIILIISLSFFLPKDQFQRAKEKLARNPDDFEVHLVLAEEYLKNNQLEEAEKELLLAHQIQKSSYQTVEKSSGGVLGVAVFSLDQLWRKKQESNPKDIKELIKYWEEVVREKPDYRDGYLRLALLHYKLYENEKAREYLQKALELDPNFEPARELERMSK